MACCNPLALDIGEWVEHAVVRVHGWQSVLGQLVIHQLHNLVHASIIVTPITDNLKHIQKYNNK